MKHQKIIEQVTVNRKKWSYYHYYYCHLSSSIIMNHPSRDIMKIEHRKKYYSNQAKKFKPYKQNLMQNSGEESSPIS